MSEAPGSGNESLSLSLARRVDALCHRFEQAWKEGRPPVIEDYLAEAPAPDRSPLLRELIALDMAYRRLAGEQPQAAAYHARFPQLAPGLSLTDADTPGPATPAGGPERADLPAPPGYEILQELGRGGMGVVYKAWQRSLHRPVALKMILAGAHAGPNELARFRTEAEAAARLQHPHIVQIHDIGQHEGRPFLALEYVDGGSLARTLDGTPWPAARTLPLVETLARAIGHAHRQGVVHRDLKPGNVLLTKEGQPKVTDFGLAKLLVGGGDPLTRTGAVLGTPSYIAPEQAEGKTQEVGPAADVYALGAILYELLTGRPPFKAATPLETVRQVVSVEPVSPRRLQPGVPRDLETICLKCLRKEPARRYVAAEDLAEDLRRFQANKPILARPVGTLERGWKWARRHPAAAALQALLVLLLVGGSASAWWYADRERARAERERAQVNQERALRQEAEGQRARAEKAEQEAKTREAEAWSVLKFLRDQVLAAARPESQDGGLGIHATIRDAVQAAEPKIAAAFRDRPLVEASIREALGQTYRYLRDDQAAIKQLEQAQALLRIHRGPDDPDTLAVMNNLANAYHSAGQLDKAIPMLEQALAEQQEKLGPDHPDTLLSMNNLATAYRDVGLLDKAVPLLEQALAKMKEQLGPDHPHTLTSMNNLATAYEEAGQAKKALPLYEQVLAKRQEQLGPDHPDTLLSMNNLAGAYRNAGQLDKALPLFKQALATLKEKLGPDHPHTLISMGNLAAAYHAAGQLDKALPLFEQALANCKEKLGADHPNTLLSMNNLATAYRDVGLLDKAVPLLEQALAKFKEQLGPEHPNTLTSMNNLAQTYQKKGDFVQAERLLRQCLAFRQQKQPDAWGTFLTQVQFGASLLGQKKYSEGEPLLVQGYEGLKQRQATIPAPNKKCLTESLERLVQLYDAWGKPDEAKKWRAEREKLPKPPEPPKTK
jgi:tetratricopeptide (TPR) repeat protein